MDIHNKEFKSRGRNGYDRYEVDNFLDEVVDNYGDALDQVVDLKNEVVSLNKKIKNLQSQVDEYNDKKKSINQSLIAAQQNADEIKVKAKADAKDIVENAKTETNYQKQQKEIISNDYKRLKKQIGEFRNRMQAMLQDEIDNLSDERWQHALDEYFNTPRFYPGADAEPIPSLEDDDEDVEDDIDNYDENDVNSSQDPDDDLDSDDFEEDDDDVEDDEADDDSAPKPMTGDSPSHETINIKPETTNNLGSKIVFPDNYKK